jgi:hypothetical protein
MDIKALLPHQRQIRMNVRNFLLPATLDESQKELEISLEKGDAFRAACIKEWISECKADGTYTESSD